MFFCVAHWAIPAYIDTIVCISSCTYTLQHFIFLSYYAKLLFSLSCMDARKLLFTSSSLTKQHCMARPKTVRFCRYRVVRVESSLNVAVDTYETGQNSRRHCLTPLEYRKRPHSVRWVVAFLMVNPCVITPCCWVRVQKTGHLCNPLHPGR